ncbi:unnamed protein product, partial [marine sediment metagenome]
RPEFALLARIGVGSERAYHQDRERFLHPPVHIVSPKPIKAQYAPRKWGTCRLGRREVTNVWDGGAQIFYTYVSRVPAVGLLCPAQGSNFEEGK